MTKTVRVKVRAKERAKGRLLSLKIAPSNLGKQTNQLGQHVKNAAPLVAEFSHIVENGDLSQPGARALSFQLQRRPSEMIEQGETSEEQEDRVNHFHKQNHPISKG